MNEKPETLSLDIPLSVTLINDTYNKQPYKQETTQEHI